MSAPLIGLGFINALVFGVQAQTSAALGEPTVKNNFLGGAIAGAVQSLLTSPMELAKTQMQVQGVGTRHVKDKVMDLHDAVSCVLKLFLYINCVELEFIAVVMTQTHLLRPKVANVITYFDMSSDADLHVPLPFNHTIKIFPQNLKILSADV